MESECTTTFKMIRAMKKKIRIIQGGQSSSKNYSIAQILIIKALEKVRLITVMTDTYDNLKDGAIQDFKHIFEQSDQDWDKHYNKSAHEINLTTNQKILLR